MINKQVFLSSTYPDISKVNSFRLSVDVNRLDCYLQRFLSITSEDDRMSNPTIISTLSHQINLVSRARVNPFQRNRKWRHALCTLTNQENKVVTVRLVGMLLLHWCLTIRESHPRVQMKQKVRLGKNFEENFEFWIVSAWVQFFLRSSKIWGKSHTGADICCRLLVRGLKKKNKQT